MERVTTKQTVQVITVMIVELTVHLTVSFTTKYFFTMQYLDIDPIMVP